MRSLHVRRGIVALVLLVALPLRVFAMAAMPCCPLVEHTSEAHAMHDDAMPSSSALPDAPDDHHHAPATTPACCAVALTSTPALPASFDYVPPRAHLPRATAIAALPTDPPERPPRTIA